MDQAADKVAVLRARFAGVGASQGTRAGLGHAPVDSCLKGGILKGALHEVFPSAPGDEGAASGFAFGLAARAAEARRVLWCGTDFAALEHGEISALGLLELGFDPGRFLLLRAPDVASVLRGALDALSCTALGAVVLEIPGAPKLLDLSASRRLVLAAAHSGVTAVLLRLDAQAEPSAAETRWLVRAAQSHASSAAQIFISNRDVAFSSPGRSVGEVASVAQRRETEGARNAIHAAAPSTASRSPSPMLRIQGATALGAFHGGGKLPGRENNDRGQPRFDAELVRHRHGRTGHWVMEWNCDEGLFAADAGAVAAASADRQAKAAHVA